MLNTHYKEGQHIKVRVTGIQPYGALLRPLTILKDLSIFQRLWMIMSII